MSTISFTPSFHPQCRSRDLYFDSWMLVSNPLSLNWRTTFRHDDTQIMTAYFISPFNVIYFVYTSFIQIHTSIKLVYTTFIKLYTSVIPVCTIFIHVYTTVIQVYTIFIRLYHFQTFIPASYQFHASLYHFHTCIPVSYQFIPVSYQFIPVSYQFILVYPVWYSYRVVVCPQCWIRNLTL